MHASFQEENFSVCKLRMRGIMVDLASLSEMIRVRSPLTQETQGAERDSQACGYSLPRSESYHLSDQLSNQIKCNFKPGQAAQRCQISLVWGQQKSSFSTEKVLGTLYKNSRKQIRCQSKEPWALNFKSHLFQILDGSQIMQSFLDLGVATVEA